MRQTTVGQPSQAPVSLKTATKRELVEQYDELADSVASLNASVTIQLTAGSTYSGVIEQYHEVSGFILAQKPSNIRVIGQVPIVGKNIFDMESDGKTFHIFIPSKNQFLVGPADLERSSSKPIRKSSASAPDRCDFLGTHSAGGSGASGGDRGNMFQLLRAHRRSGRTIEWCFRCQRIRGRRLGDSAKNMVRPGGFERGAN